MEELPNLYHARMCTALMIFPDRTPHSLPRKTCVAGPHVVRAVGKAAGPGRGNATALLIIFARSGLPGRVHLQLVVWSDTPRLRERLREKLRERLRRASTADSTM